jgi:hypothetical protein
LGKQTLVELSRQSRKSVSTLQREFDKLLIAPEFPLSPTEAVNLVVDATFFSRSDGVLVFRANGKNIYWRFIYSETVAEVAAGLDVLDKMGYRFSSVTLDGKRGIIRLFAARYPSIPIQFCQFHQAQIIRRYTTNNPQTDCGKELKAVMRSLTQTDQSTFQSLIETVHEQYAAFLKERNDNNQFKHRRLRSAFRSLKTNIPYLFAYKNYPELTIPNTTNSCDGAFAHWKQKLKIHRGIKHHRRNKMINFLLNHS